MAKPILYLSRITLLFLFSILNTQAQEKFIGFVEPEIKLSYQVAPKYSHSFGLGNRNMVYRNGKFDHHVKHIELSHLSGFEIHPNYELGLGVLYRFEHAFDANEENEFRLQEQFSYTSKNANYKTKHRFKVEQRFYASETKHRFRYQLGYTFVLAEENRFQPYLKADTESLLEVGKYHKPELEQRLGVGIGWSLNSKANLEVGAEYQVEDYTQDLNHELFLVVALGITI